MFAERLKKFDLFGRSIKFTYQGIDYFTTNCGRAVTFLTVLAFLLLMSLKFVEFFGEHDSILYLNSSGQSADALMDLQELNFSLAIEELEPRFGTLELSHVDWSGEDGIKSETPISLQPCETLNTADLSFDNSYVQAR